MQVLGRGELTARRRQTLEALHAGVAGAGRPVHYSELAEPLGISPWTAYDLLRELEHAGLAQAVYGHRPGAAVGRPQVAFAPTEAGRALLGPIPGTPPEERALRRARARFAGVGAVAAARALLDRTRSADLAGHLGFWLNQADTLSLLTRDRLHRLVRTAPEAATALSMFVAAVYGAVDPRDSELSEALVAEAAAFQARLARTTAARRERLARSLATLLDPHPQGPAAAAPPAGAPRPGLPAAAMKLGRA